MNFNACNRCNEKLMYINSFDSKYDLILGNDIIHDKDIPTMIFVFGCSSCSNRIILEDSNGEICVTYGYGSKNALHVIVSS
jgi:hypothetical protein